MDPIKPASQPNTPETPKTDQTPLQNSPESEDLAVNSTLEPSASESSVVSEPTPTNTASTENRPGSDLLTKPFGADPAVQSPADSNEVGPQVIQPTVFAPTDTLPKPTVTESPQSIPVAPAATYPASSTPYSPTGSDGGVVAVSHDTTQAVPQQPKSKKKLFIVGAVAAFTLLAGGGAIFGLYLPSRPENVFNRGLERTGTAMYTLVTEATNKDTQAKYKSNIIKGEIELDSDSMGKASATIDGKTSTDAVQVDAKLSWSQSDAPARDYAAKFMSSIPSGKKYPNLYVQLSGFKDLVAGTEFEQYDGKWLFLSSEYLESLAESYGESPTKQENITVADVNALAKDMTKVGQEYVFTADPDKAVLENRGFIGKEEIDGVKANRYTVGLNVTNAKKLCAATADVAYDSTLVKKQLSDAEARAKGKANFLKSCQDSAGKTKSSETFDMWIGGKYGLIRKVRVMDDNKKDYVEFGQSYDGGDVIPVYVSSHIESDQKTDIRVDVTNNTKTGALIMDITGKGTATDSKFTLTGKVSATPNKTPPEITEPTGAVDLQKLFEQFQQSAMSSQAQADANTAEAQSQFDAMNAEDF